MASPAVNVVRYSALIAGVFYGIVHKRTLQANKIEHEHHGAQHRKEELILRAKEEWRRKQSAGKGDGVITNPDDPKFDLELFVDKWERENEPRK